MKSLLKHCSRVRFLFVPVLLGSVLCACASTKVENTPASMVQMFDTAVQTRPLDAQARDELHKLANEELIKKISVLEQGLQPLMEQRKQAFDLYKKEFPDCRTQKHCLSILMGGDVKRFERFQELNKNIIQYDRPLVEKLTGIANAKRRHSAFVRWIFNRYLAGELIKLRDQKGEIAAIRVYGLEAFSQRRDISKRLFRYAGADAMLVNMGDLDFRMHGQAIDEAAILLTLEVELKPKRTAPDEAPISGPYYVTFLLNSQSTDPTYYDLPFRQVMTEKLADQNQTAFAQESACGLYSIASSSLLPRLQVANYFQCQEYRAKQQSAAISGLEAIEDSVVPLAYLPRK